MTGGIDGSWCEQRRDSHFPRTSNAHLDRGGDTPDNRCMGIFTKPASFRIKQLLERKYGVPFEIKECFSVGYYVVGMQGKKRCWFAATDQGPFLVENYFCVNLAQTASYLQFGDAYWLKLQAHPQVHLYLHPSRAETFLNSMPHDMKKEN